MKVIKDIRLYKSAIENIDGNSLPSGFLNKNMNIIVHRIVMKLRENGFSLGEFDHLYINFTPLLDEGSICLAKRSVDRYFPWYRYYDVGVTQAIYDVLDQGDHLEYLIELIRKVLLHSFLHQADDQKIINSSIDEAIAKGEEMLMLYKEKSSAKLRARLYLRYLDDAYYKPLLVVSDLIGSEVLHEDLPKIMDFSVLGEIQLSNKKVTIKPRKNAYSKENEPIEFVL